MILESAAMNPTDATAICLLQTTKTEETDPVIEAIIAKGAGMTVDLTTAGDLDLHSDHDLLTRDTEGPGAHTTAIATYHADEMDPSTDEDETADPSAPCLRHHLRDRVRHRAAAPVLQPRADEETRRAAKTSNGSDRGPDHARRGEMQIDLGAVEIETDRLLRRRLADKTREANLVAEVDHHLHPLRPAVPEAIPRQAAVAAVAAAAMVERAGAHQRIHL